MRCRARAGGAQGNRRRRPRHCARDVQPLAVIMAETIAGRRTALALVTIFGGFSLALSAVGIFSVMAISSG